MAIKASRDTEESHTINSASGQEAVDEDWALLPVAVDGE